MKASENRVWLQFQTFIGIADRGGRGSRMVTVIASTGVKGSGPAGSVFEEASWQPPHVVLLDEDEDADFGDDDLEDDEEDLDDDLEEDLDEEDLDEEDLDDEEFDDEDDLDDDDEDEFDDDDDDEDEFEDDEEF